MQLKYPIEEVESLKKGVLAEILTKFYQEIKQDDGKEHSRLAHFAIKAGINRYSSSEAVGKTFSIIADPTFNKTLNKSLNARLKKIIERSSFKVTRECLT